MPIRLLCPSSACDAFIPYSLRETDQNLQCRECGEEFLFFNAGCTHCRVCDKQVVVGLSSLAAQAQCNCGRIIPFLISASGDPMVKPWRIENESAWQYCGLNFFDHHEDSMREGKAFFDNRMRGGWFSQPNRTRGIYLSLLKISTDLHVKNVRMLHGYTNFKWHEHHENAKFMSFISPKSISTMLERLTKEKGLVDIWIKGEELNQALIQMGSLAPYKARFKLTA